MKRGQKNSRFPLIRKLLLGTGVLLFANSCQGEESKENSDMQTDIDQRVYTPTQGETGRAIFAGGCFWGVEHLFAPMDGVKSVISGYTGGTRKNPSYKDVIYRNTGEVEAVEIIYDPAKVSYEELVRFFFNIHDPTQVNGQGPDIGAQYLSEIFYENDSQKESAEKTIAELESLGYDVATTLKEVKPFYKAEEYHQDYYAKNGKSPYCHSYFDRFSHPRDKDASPLFF